MLDEREDDFFTFAMGRMLAEANSGVKCKHTGSGFVSLGEGCLTAEKEHSWFGIR